MLTLAPRQTALPLPAPVLALAPNRMRPNAWASLRSIIAANHGTGPCYTTWAL